MDTWVFDKVHTFLQQDIIDKEKTVYFLHLLGLDTAGHIHKPNSLLFNDNLELVDNGIKSVVEQFNRKFPDEKTAFIFTSDHGMTNKGSHGAGTELETETPFVAWGAGLRSGKSVDRSGTQSLFIIENTDIPKFEIKQADVAPLMSSLLGIATPVNNVGQLPTGFLDTSDEYKAKAIYSNALQISAQFKYLQNQYRQGFFFTDFHELSESNLLSIEYEIQTAIRTKDFKKAIRFCEHFIELSIDGIEYFRAYYEKIMLLAVGLGLIGWIFWLYQQLNVESNETKASRKAQENQKWFLFILGSLLLLSLFVYIQRIPLQTGIFFVLPAIFWLPVRTSNMLTVFKKFDTWIWIAGIEIFVLTFYHRFFLCGLLVAVVAYDFVQLKDKKANLEMFFKWALNSALLAIFPALPIVDKETNNITFLLIGIAAWGSKIFFALKSNRTRFKVVNLVVFTIGAVNFLLIVRDLNNQQGLSESKQVISWVVLVLSFIMPLLSPNSFRDRLTAILSSLCIPYSLMSLSYEPLFFMIFSSSIYYWVLMVYTLKRQQHSIPEVKPTTDGSIIESVDFKRAFISILYILSSLFGTGNIASVSSFDPNWVRCFVSTFAPFLMATLIIVKLIIPVLLVMCAVKLIISINKTPLDKFFIILLICCDIMCLNFLFLVRNKGSWLEIGTSISHFVIMEATVLVLCILQFIAHLLTTWQLDSLFGFSKTRDLSFNDAKVE